MITDLTIDLYEQIRDANGVDTGTRFAKFSTGDFARVTQGLREGKWSFIIVEKSEYNPAVHRILFRGLKIKLWTDDALAHLQTKERDALLQAAKLFVCEGTPVARQKLITAVFSCASEKIP